MKNNKKNTKNDNNIEENTNMHKNILGIDSLVYIYIYIINDLIIL